MKESDDDSFSESLLVLVLVGAVVGLIGRAPANLEGDFRFGDLEVSLMILERSGA